MSKNAYRGHRFPLGNVTRPHFNQQRHLCGRENFKLHRSTALAEWRELNAT